MPTWSLQEIYSTSPSSWYRTEPQICWANQRRVAGIWTGFSGNCSLWCSFVIPQQNTAKLHLDNWSTWQRGTVEHNTQINTNTRQFHRNCSCLPPRWPITAIIPHAHPPATSWAEQTCVWSSSWNQRNSHFFKCEFRPIKMFLLVDLHLYLVSLPYIYRWKRNDTLNRPQIRPINFNSRPSPPTHPEPSDVM